MDPSTDFLTQLDAGKADLQKSGRWNADTERRYNILRSFVTAQSNLIANERAAAQRSGLSDPYGPIQDSTVYDQHPSALTSFFNSATRAIPSAVLGVAGDVQHTLSTLDANELRKQLVARGMPLDQAQAQATAKAQSDEQNGAFGSFTNNARDFLDRYVTVDPEGKISSMAGTLGADILTSLAVPGYLPAAMAARGSDETYREALRAGATPNVAAGAGAGVGAVQAALGLGLGSFSKPLGAAFGDALGLGARPLTQEVAATEIPRLLLARAGAGAIEGGALMPPTVVAENLIKRGTYEPDRSLLEGVPESIPGGILGGAMGGVSHGAKEAIGGSRYQAKLEADMANYERLQELAKRQEEEAAAAKEKDIQEKLKRIFGNAPAHVEDPTHKIGKNGEKIPIVKNVKGTQIPGVEETQQEMLLHQERNYETIAKSVEAAKNLLIRHEEAQRARERGIEPPPGYPTDDQVEVARRAVEHGEELLSREPYQQAAARIANKEKTLQKQASETAGEVAAHVDRQAESAAIRKEVGRHLDSIISEQKRQIAAKDAAEAKAAEKESKARIAAAADEQARREKEVEALRRQTSPRPVQQILDDIDKYTAQYGNAKLNGDTADVGPLMEELKASREVDRKLIKEHLAHLTMAGKLGPEQYFSIVEQMDRAAEGKKPKMPPGLTAKKPKAAAAEIPESTPPETPPEPPATPPVEPDRGQRRVATKTGKPYTIKYKHGNNWVVQFDGADEAVYRDAKLVAKDQLEARKGPEEPPTSPAPPPENPPPPEPPTTGTPQPPAPETPPSVAKAEPPAGEGVIDQPGRVTVADTGSVTLKAGDRVTLPSGDEGVVISAPDKAGKVKIKWETGAMVNHNKGKGVSTEDAEVTRNSPVQKKEAPNASSNGQGDTGDQVGPDETGQGPVGQGGDQSRLGDLQQPEQAQAGGGEKEVTTADLPDPGDHVIIEGGKHDGKTGQLIDGETVKTADGNVLDLRNGGEPRRMTEAERSAELERRLVGKGGRGLAGAEVEPVSGTALTFAEAFKRAFDRPLTTRVISSDGERVTIRIGEHVMTVPKGELGLPGDKPRPQAPEPADAEEPGEAPAERRSLPPLGSTVKVLPHGAFRIPFDAKVTGYSGDGSVEVEHPYAGTVSVKPENIEQPIRNEARTSRGGKEFAKLGIDPRAMDTLGKNFYRSSLSHVLVRETLQNALDAIRRNKGAKKIDISSTHSYNRSSGDPTTVLTVTDNGSGITKAKMFKALTDVGAEGKDVGSAGGLGLAKIALFGKAVHIRVESVARERGGKLTRSVMEGSGTDYKTTGLPVTSHEVPDGTQTGTVFRLEFPDSEVSYWDMERSIRRVTSESSLGDVELTIGGEALSDSPGGAATPVREVESRDVAGAKVTISTSQEEATVSGIDVAVTNNGLLQFHDYRMLPAKIPVSRRVVVEVTPTVSPESEDYPFSSNRDELKGEALKAFNDLLKSVVINKSAQRRNDSLADALNSSKEMVHSKVGAKVVAEGGENEVTKMLVNSKHAAAIADMASKFYQNVKRFVGDNIGGLERHTTTEFLGLSHGAQYNAALIHAKKLGLPENVVVLDILNTLGEERGNMEGLGTSLAQKFGSHLAAALVHEDAHAFGAQYGDGHDQSFASAFTRGVSRGMAEMVHFADAVAHYLNSNEGALEELARIQEVNDAVKSGSGMFGDLGVSHQSAGRDGLRAGGDQGGAGGGVRPVTDAGRDSEGEGGQGNDAGVFVRRAARQGRLAKVLTPEAKKAADESAKKLGVSFEHPPDIIHRPTEAMKKMTFDEYRQAQQKARLGHWWTPEDDIFRGSEVGRALTAIGNEVYNFRAQVVGKWNDAFAKAQDEYQKITGRKFQPNERSSGGAVVERYDTDAAREKLRKLASRITTPAGKKALAAQFQELDRIDKNIGGNPANSKFLTSWGSIIKAVRHSDDNLYATHNAQPGAYKKAGQIENHYPHHIRQEWQGQLANPNSEAARGFDELVAAQIKEFGIKDPRTKKPFKDDREIMDFVQALRSRNVGEGAKEGESYRTRQGSFELSRLGLEIPAYVDYDLGSMDAYLRRGAAATVTARYLWNRPDPESPDNVKVGVNQAVAGIKHALNQELGGDADVSGLVDRYLDHWGLVKRKQTGLSRGFQTFSRGVSQYGLAPLLSGVRQAVQNPFTTSTVGFGVVGPWHSTLGMLAAIPGTMEYIPGLKTAGKLAGRALPSMLPSGRTPVEALRQAGSLNVRASADEARFTTQLNSPASIINELTRERHLPFAPRLDRAASGLINTFLLGPFKLTDVNARISSGLSTIWKANALLDLVANKGKPTPWGVQLAKVLNFNTKGYQSPEAAEKYLTETLGMSKQDIEESLLLGHLTEQAENKILHRGTDLQNPAPSPKTLPGVALEPGAAPFRAFRSYQANVAYRTYDHVWTELKRGNPGPLSALMLGTTASSAAMNVIIEALLGKKDRRSDHFDTAAGRMGAKLIEAAVNSGTMALPFDPLQPGRTLSSIDAGPVALYVSPFTQLAESGLKIARRPDQIGGAILDDLAGRITAIRDARQMWMRANRSDTYKSVYDAARSSADNFNVMGQTSGYTEFALADMTRAAQRSEFNIGNEFRQEQMSVVNPLLAGRPDEAFGNLPHLIEAIYKKESKTEPDPDVAFQNAITKAQNLLMARAPLAQVTKSGDLESDEAGIAIAKYLAWMQKAGKMDKAKQYLNAHQAYVTLINAAFGK